MSDRKHGVVCDRCRNPHAAINDMTPWDYYHSAANLGKYEDCATECSYCCACRWLDGIARDMGYMLVTPDLTA